MRARVVGMIIACVRSHTCGRDVCECSTELVLPVARLASPLTCFSFFAFLQTPLLRTLVLFHHSSQHGPAPPPHYNYNQHQGTRSTNGCSSKQNTPNFVTSSPSNATPDRPRPPLPPEHSPEQSRYTGMVTATPGVLLKTCVRDSGHSLCCLDATRAAVSPDARRRTPDARSHQAPPPRAPVRSKHTKTKNSDIPIVQYLKHLNEKQAPM